MGDPARSPPTTPRRSSFNAINIYSARQTRSPHFRTTSHPRRRACSPPPDAVVPNAADPANPTLFYGGPNLYRTTNPAATPPSWTAVTAVGSYVTAIATSATNPAVVYVGFKTGTGHPVKPPRVPRERSRLINRYYEPTSPQFLTVDPAYALTLSVYGYVNNDPLNFTDPSRAFALTLLGGPIGAVVGTTIGTVSYLANHGSHGLSARGLAGAAVGGFVGGGIAGACDGSTGVLVACGALGRAAGEFTGELISGDRLSVQRIGVAGLFGGVGGGISGRIVPTV